MAWAIAGEAADVVGDECAGWGGVRLGLLIFGKPGRFLKKSGVLKRVAFGRHGSQAVKREALLRDQLEKTYRLHRQGLFSLALSITGCRQLAEDAIQSAFERLCRSSLTPTGDVVNYVFASVRNSSRDATRSNRRALELRETIFNGYSPAESTSASPDDNVLTAERDEILRLAVEALDESDRETVVLKIFAGLTFDAIGEVLEQPAKTVATRYRRALVKLEERLRGQL